MARTTELRHGNTVYRLESISDTLANVTVETHGKPIAKRQYTGARTAVLAQITWSRLAGLTGKERAA